MCTLGRSTHYYGCSVEGRQWAGAIKPSGKATQPVTLTVPMAWPEQIPAGMTASVKGVQNEAWLSSSQPAERLRPYTYPPRQEPFPNASPDPNRWGICTYSLAKSMPTSGDSALDRLWLIHDGCLCSSHMGRQLPMGLLLPWPRKASSPWLPLQQQRCCGQRPLLWRTWTSPAYMLSIVPSTHCYGKFKIYEQSQEQTRKKKIFK